MDGSGQHGVTWQALGRPRLTDKAVLDRHGRLFLEDLLWSCVMLLWVHIQGSKVNGKACMEAEEGENRSESGAAHAHVDW